MLYKITDLKNILYVGAISKEQLNIIPTTYTKQVMEVHDLLTKWHERITKKLGIDTETARRKRMGFDGVIHWIPGLFKDDFNFCAISERTKTMIKEQTSNYNVTSQDKDNIFDKDAKPETIRKLNVAAILVVSIVIFLLASNPPQLLAQLITYATGGLTVVFFHVVLLGLFWKRANEYGAVAGIVSGILLYFLIDKGILAVSLGFNACIMATLLSTLIAVIVSLLTPKTPYGIIRTWFGRVTE